MCGIATALTMVKSYAALSKLTTMLAMQSKVFIILK